MWFADNYICDLKLKVFIHILKIHFEVDNLKDTYLKGSRPLKYVSSTYFFENETRNKLHFATLKCFQTKMRSYSKLYATQNYFVYDTTTKEINNSTAIINYGNPSIYYIQRQTINL